MSANHRVAVVGDFNPRNHTHMATNESLAHVGLVPVWVPTDAVDADPAAQLAPFPGIWIAPASPYRDMDGALRAVRHARERGVPLVGT
jgi:CTP synthase (UTP-ammonia lyase)